MANPIQEAQTALGSLFMATTVQITAVYNYVLRYIIQDEAPSQANADALAAAHDALDASGADVLTAFGRIFEPCPNTCQGIVAAASLLVDALFANVEGSYSGGTYAQAANQVLVGWNAQMNTRLGGVYAAQANLNQNICQCDIEASGGANQAELSCFNGAPVGGGPAPTTQWWHTSQADCPTWNPNGSPHSCQCGMDPM